MPQLYNIVLYIVTIYFLNILWKWWRNIDDPLFRRLVSVCISALGWTDHHLIDADVKINGKYYRDVLLTWDLLPDIRQHSDYFIFQQDGAPAHRAKETVKLLKTATPDFMPPTLWPPNSPDINPVDYKIWGSLQERAYRRQIKMLMSCAIALWMNGISWSRTSLTRQLDSGDEDFGLVSLQVDILSTNCEETYISLIFLLC